MPKKKVTKTASKNNRSSGRSAHTTDDHSFLIIIGGGFLVILLIVLFMGNRTSLYRAVSNKMDSRAMEMEKSDDTVMIKDSAFDKSMITVKVGDTVTWENTDTMEHSAVADDNTFDTKVLAPGEKGSYTFTQAGTYTYHCGIHPTMTATVVVE